jgi:hypothetical protein
VIGALLAIPAAGIIQVVAVEIYGDRQSKRGGEVATAGAPGQGAAVPPHAADALGGELRTSASDQDGAPTDAPEAPHAPPASPPLQPPVADPAPTPPQPPPVAEPPGFKNQEEDNDQSAAHEGERGRRSVSRTGRGTSVGARVRTPAGARVASQMTAEHAVAGARQPA